MSSFAAHQSLDFDDRAAETYGTLRYELEKAGQVIGPFDLQIAAVALTHDLILVSGNVREFGRIPALKVVDWAAPVT